VSIEVEQAFEDFRTSKFGLKLPCEVLARALHSSFSMRRILQVLSITALLLALAPAAHAQVSFNIHIGTPPPAPRAYRVPPQPGPDYEWVEGYWYPVNGRYAWHDGYWTHAPYPGAYWVPPYYERGEYYPGYWEGRQGEVHHDHRWDEGRDRDDRWGRDERGTNGSYESERNERMTRERAQAIVRSAYKNVLGREPDPGSAGYLDRVVNDHWSQQQIENELRNSAEYRQKHLRR
jgi:hypothetical protein